MNEMYAGMDTGNWLQYAADLSRSTKRRRRKQTHENALGLLEEGQTLIVACELAGSSKPLHIIIDDFAAFNWIMDKLDNPWDELLSILIQPAELTVDVMP